MRKKTKKNKNKIKKMYATIAQTTQKLKAYYSMKQSDNVFCSIAKIG